VGERYRFGLTGIADGVGLLDGAAVSVGKRGATPHRGGDGTLDGRFEVASSERVDRSMEGELTALSAERGPIDIWLLTPMYIARPRPATSGSGLNYLDRDAFDLRTFLTAVGRRYLEFADPAAIDTSGNIRQGALPPIPRGADADASALINIHFDPVRTVGRPNPVLGVQGLLRLDGISDDWVPLLVFGAMASVGHGLGYGQGAYALARAAYRSPDPCPPIGSILEPALRKERLAECEQHVIANIDQREGGAFPEEKPDREALDRMVRAIRDGAFTPGSLRGARIPKKASGWRYLAIPSATERVLQRAVQQTLDSDIDALFEDSSYAFRKGRSVGRGASAMERARAKGMKWVLDADITSFFDNVDWGRLEIRLRGLLGNDPVIPVIMSWMRAPVVLNGKRFRRTRGLPQGSPLSPLLANLYLDELDEHLAGAGFAVVRYADDFVVLCRDPDAARIARDEVVTELTHLGLTLNEDKTRITSFDEGFNFLGLHFQGDQWSPVDEPVPDAEAVPKEVALPKGAWLAQVPLETLRRAGEPVSAKETEGEAADETATPTDWKGPLGERPLFVTGTDARIQLRGDKVAIERPGEELVELPLRSISQVTLIGPTRATIPLVLRCVGLGIPVYFCASGGRLRAAVAPPPEWGVLQRQSRWSNDDAFRLAFTRSVVEAKLHNAATIGARFGFTGQEDRGVGLRRIRDQCESAGSVDELLGLEGSGARFHFEGWGASLDPVWGFGGRRKHPAPDPVNAMLSLAYSVLYNQVSCVLVAAGLDPRIGVLHRMRGAHHALASDIQEEFRHLGESAVWSLVSHRRVTPDSFVSDGPGRACRMADDTRRMVVSGVLDRWFQEFTPDEGGKLTYLEFAGRQARSLANAFLRGDAAQYCPLRLHA
jgi:group II intron reverse transcriptase/maturase/CRISPR-associated endonuclease Cas1